MFNDNDFFAAMADIGLNFSEEERTRIVDEPNEKEPTHETYSFSHQSSSLLPGYPSR